jgi:nucleoside-diphosphate-sugar epimerase
LNALITGGAGFIGSNLASRLLADGHHIAVLDNLSSGYQCNLDTLPGVEFMRGDIRDERSVRLATAGREVVFHLAASVGNKRSIDDPVADADTNVIGTLRLLEAARHAGVRKFVTSSSAGIFGELNTLPIREDHPVEPDSPYGASKLCAEKETLAFGKLYGIETVCLRYFNVYGPHQRFDAYGNVIPIFVFQALRNEALTIFGDGDQTRDLVNVHDVVQANIRAAMTPGLRGAFNIGSGANISINCLVEKLRRVLGVPFEVRYGPPRPGDVRDSLADITAARHAFGFCPAVGLDKGLSEYVAWARQEVFAYAS